MEQQESHERHITLLGVFLTFSGITLSGFGGAMFWLRYRLVERQRWLTAREFVEFVTLGQLLPGPTGLNLTALVGYRFGGWKGATAALAGFLGWPCLIIAGMGMLYQQYGTLPQVRRALAGMSIVAASLLFANGVKLAVVLPRRWLPWLFGVLAFVSVGILRWPIPWVIAALGPCAVLVAWKENK